MLCPSSEEPVSSNGAVNLRGGMVGVTIDSNDDEVGKNACNDIASRMMPLTAQVFSPYRNDKPMTS